MASEETSPQETTPSSHKSPEGTPSTAAGMIRTKIAKPILHVEEVENDAIKVAWTEAYGAKNYHVLSTRTLNGSKRDSTYSVKETYHVIGGATPGAEYTIRVKAEAEDETPADYSDPVEAMSGPPAPKNVKAVISPSSSRNSVTVNFEDPDETPKSYEVVMINSENGEEVAQRVEKTFAVFRDLRPSLSYEFFVRSCCVNTYPGPKYIYSRKVYVPREIPTRPAEVQSVRSIGFRNGVARIQWNPSEGATGYDVVCTEEGKVTNQYLTNKSHITIPNPSNGRMFAVTVAARNEAGQGPFSEVTELQTEPEPPSGMKVGHYPDSPDTTLLVNVEEPNPGDDQEIVFTAKPLKIGGKDVVKTLSSGWAFIKDLTPGEVYQIYVVTKRNGVDSSRYVHKDLVHMYPQKPNNLRVSAKDDCLRVTWDELPIKPTKYRVEISVNGKVYAEESQSNKILKKGVMPSTLYQIKVAGVNEAGCGAYSMEKTTFTVPEPPMDPRVQHNPDSPKTSLLVSFKESERSKKQYKITAEPKGSGQKAEIITRENTAILSGLTPGELYTVRIVAFVRFEDQEHKSDEVYCSPVRKEH